MTPILKILAFSAISLSTLCGCTQSPWYFAPADPDNLERFRPIMFYNCVPVGETDPYAEEKKAFSGAAERMKQLSADEKTTLALAIVDEYDKALTPLGLNLVSPDFMTEFVLAACKNSAVKAADEAMWEDMLGWQDVLPAAMSQLPQKLQQKLEHEYMAALLDCYAAFMIMRYAEMNEALPATTRARARAVVGLIIAHADGENGHRDFGVYDSSVYIPMLPDYSRVPGPEEHAED